MDYTFRKCYLCNFNVVFPISGVLLSLEVNDNYNYTESGTIKLKDVKTINETILPSPPPYQESDPLTQIHFKKFTKKKNSQTAIPTPHNIATVSSEQIENELPETTNKSFDVSPSPKEEKIDKKYSFLHQVPTPTELPKLAFDFPTKSLPNLNDPSSEPSLKSSQSTHSLIDDQSKPNEKKTLFGYFGLKKGIKTENDVSKVKNEKKEKKEPPIAPKIEKPIVKKIRVLKTDNKKENVPKVKAAIKNERLAPVNIKSESSRHSETNLTENSTLPHMEIMENRMEIDYFHKVKKAKPNRVPIIVKSPKPEMKFEEKPSKSEVFRHEETFSAANGPLKAKKKKTKSVPEDTGIVAAMKPIEVLSKDVNQKQTEFLKLNEPPIPKPRLVLKLDGFDDDTRETQIDNKSKKNVVIPVLSSPSSPSDTEDTWNLVAKHRLNTRAITATAISARQKSDSEETKNSSILQMKQIDMLNKPKTMREMKREQEEKRERMFNFGEKDDKESDTEA